MSKWRSLNQILQLKSSDRNFTVPYDDELSQAKENIKPLLFYLEGCQFSVEMVLNVNHDD